VTAHVDHQTAPGEAWLIFNRDLAERIAVSVGLHELQQRGERAQNTRLPGSLDGDAGSGHDQSIMVVFVHSKKVRIGRAAIDGDGDRRLIHRRIAHDVDAGAQCKTMSEPVGGAQQQGILVSPPLKAQAMLQQKSVPLPMDDGGQGHESWNILRRTG
jgi:hypothetical protein